MFSLFIIHILSHSMVQMLYCILNFPLFYIHSRVLLLLHDTFLLIIFSVAIYSFDFFNILKSAVLNYFSITIRMLVIFVAFLLNITSMKCGLCQKPMFLIPLFYWNLLLITYLYRIILHVYIRNRIFHAEPYFKWVLVFVNFELMMWMLWNVCLSEF